MHFGDVQEDSRMRMTGFRRQVSDYAVKHDLG